MAHIVILGCGIGGMPAAYEFRETLGKEHRVTVIHNGSRFQFTPSNPWVAVGWREPADVSIEAAPFLERKGIEFIGVACSAIDPDGNRLTLEDGRTVDYDYLVIATGPKLAFDEVDGMGPDGHSQSVCTLEHAEKASSAWSAFVQDPGPVVVGAAQLASCFGPAYEFAFIMDADLRKRKMRDRVPMTFVTSEPYIGHLGLGGVGDSKGMLESELRQHHINWICNAKIVRVEADKVHVAEHDAAGELIRQHELPCKYSMILPAFRGIEPVAAVGEDLVNPRGFVKVNEYQQNPRWTNVFSVGVCIAIPPVESTPVPTGAPKTGYMIESMVTATVRNVGNMIEGKAPDRSATWNAICLADLGDTGVAFVAMPQMPPRNLSWMKKGKWVHVAKIAFEKYFLRKMKKGTSEPVFEKYMLGALGITKLK
ncbi:MAG: NAD(P)/FAD-dependent oxidoreductase [Proteobacteria bacterium]|nr:MAG: NAD(P)/FAD-dependent oxidoreductase [Pseudomonadota bacterium]